MAKDDYFMLVYRVLTYLYNQLKSGEVVDTEKLTSEWLGIPETYWEYIFHTLKDEGLIREVAFQEDMTGKRLDPNLQISPKGISFLHENSTIQKIKNSIAGIADVVGNIRPL